MSKVINYSTISILLAGIQGWAVASGQPTDYKMQLQSKAFEAIANKQKPLTEQAYMEVADWFGNTGLPEQVERSLPRHLRQQLGQFVGDHSALKASDLKYLGARIDEQNEVHYWELSARHMSEKFAYLFIDKNGSIQISIGDQPMPQ